MSDRSRVGFFRMGIILAVLNAVDPDVMDSLTKVEMKGWRSCEFVS